jgi:hypothetical protein
MGDYWHGDEDHQFWEDFEKAQEENWKDDDYSDD